MDKLIILQTVLPDYRRTFFSVLLDRLGTKFELYGGSCYFESSVKTAENIPHHHVKNNFLLFRRFLWQKNMIQIASSRAIVVLEMNPRILSNWVILIMRKRKNLPTILWGHAWPRGGKDSKSDRLRQQMRKLANGIIVYTKEQAADLKEKMPSKDIYAAPNALFRKEDMKPSISKNVNNIIYVGRLTKAKKAAFMVSSFAKLIHHLPKETNLIIVGDGEEKASIQEFTIHLGIKDRVQLLGHISDFEVLRNLYAQSLFSVSPGYVGLSITQSIGFGVPMLISRNEPHSPELEAVIVDYNAVYYDTDDVDSFCESALSFFLNRKNWLSKREEISNNCKEGYSVENMATVFINLTKKYVH